MSRQPPIRPEQGSYGQFQLPASQPKTPYSRSKEVLAKLRESIPQNEAQWQHTRDLHGYSTAENASLLLAPAFILKYRHPQYRFGDICAALGTEVLSEDDYARFVSVLESGRPVSTVLSLPANAPLTALSVFRNQAKSAREFQKVAADTANDLDMLVLPTSFPLVYKLFGVSDASQQLLQETTHRITYESLREVPNTPLLELRWIDDYEIIVDQLVGDLVG
ncbi:hypothetical protein FAGAP_2113 [Fusarium agapanthi]|uniref:Uncharacterized protein n=1 Tax=Fusarium agapanthi TaxID=1803897 RepID=A0A9P5BMW6_9HYPO|nr:hypothetical protein FAGAP_2113 [Fusarium agapanthi]